MLRRIMYTCSHDGAGKGYHKNTRGWMFLPVSGDVSPTGMGQPVNIYLKKKAWPKKRDFRPFHTECGGFKKSYLVRIMQCRINKSCIHFYI